MTDQTNQRVRVTYLGKLIKRKRQLEEITLQQVSNQIEISIATLSRLERQSNIKQGEQNVITPDTRTVMALANWLAIPLDELFEHDEHGSGEESVNLPLLVDTHLRANRKLKPEDADFISRIFREMYDKYVSHTGEGSTVSDKSQNGED